jgi:O-antigen/teichoic acid export membrane protein
LVLPLNKHKRSKRISLILIFSALINLAGNFWLVPLYGKMGASWATLMAQAVAMLWFIYEVRRCEVVNLQTGKSLLLFGVWLAMVALSSFVADLSFWAGLLMKGGVLSLFLLLLWFLRLVGPEDWTAALRFFRKE